MEVELLKDKSIQGVERLKEVRHTPEERTSYRKKLSEHISEELILANPMRLCWLVNYFSLSGICYLSLVAFKLPLVSMFLLSITIGFLNSMMAFSTHELLHGGVIKSKGWQRVLGVIGFAPFSISPTFWNVWHNEHHHERTQQGSLDPMAWPSVDEYEKSSFHKKMFNLTPGSGTRKSYLFFFYWTSLYYFCAQFMLRFQTRHFTVKEHILISFENLLQFSLLGGLLYITEPSLWLWCFVIPFFVQNYMFTSYEVLSNSLMPITETNDTLNNTMNIRNHPLNFIHHFSGYNIEHAIYPEAPFSSLPKISVVAKEFFGNKYTSVTKLKAIKVLYKTPRVYKNNKDFIHPETQKVTTIKLLK